MAAAKLPGSNVTAKQEAFAQAFVELGVASEAYRRCYNVKPDAKPEGIHSDAYQLLNNPDVSLRVKQLQLEHAKRHAITVDSLTAMLKEDRELARHIDEPAAAISAVMAMAKLHGHVVDRKSVTSDNRHHHDTSELSPLAQFLSDAAGVGAEAPPKGSVSH